MTFDPKTYQPKILPITRLGNPLLRETARRLTREEILSDEIQQLIADIRYTCQKEEYGVGMAAPQMGKNLAFSVINIKPTSTRPDLEPFDSVIINPEIVETFGRKHLKWEGCMSCGTYDDTLYAQVPRYNKIRLKYLDENAAPHDEILEGFPAHVAQHETDHLNGIVFLDKVEDTKSFMMGDEYRERVAKKRKKS